MQPRFALALLLVPAWALAQTAGVEHSDNSRGVTLPPTAAALVDEATAPVVNPAGVRFVEGAQLFYIHERAVARNQVIDGLYLGDSFFDWLGVGFNLEWVRSTPGQSYRKTTWSLALGSPVLSLGAAYNVFSSRQDVNLDQLTSWDLGVTLRPDRHLAFAAVFKNIDQPSRGSVTFYRQYDLSAGLRPWDNRWTLGLDYLFSDERGFGSGRAQYTLKAQIIPGVLLGGGISHGFRSGDDFLFQLSATVNASHLGLTYSQGVGPRGLDYEVAVRLSSQPYRALSFSEGKVALVELDRWLNQPSSPSLELLGFSGGDPYLRLVRFLDESIRDPQLKGVVLKIDSLPKMGLGKAEELRQGLKRLQAAGKKVLVILQMAGDSEYLMVSPADKIFALSEAEMPINGFSARAVFLGDAMNKLGVKWDVARVGAYKNAPDALTRSQMSQEQEESIMAYLDTDVRVFKSAVAAGRHLDSAGVDRIWKQGLLTAGEAKSLGLVDQVITHADIPALVAEWLPKATYQPGYRPRELQQDAWSQRRQIAVIRVAGTITQGRSQKDPFGLAQTTGSDTVIRAFRQAQEDDRVVAIILRVDSGGGDGLASSLIYHAALQAKKKKPVIASMGDVAASGGYYAAMGADEVLAPATAITGSIGVFLLKPGVTPLAEKLGIHHKTLKRGEYSDFLNLWDPWTPDQKKAAQQWVDTFYDSFITEVSKSRRLTKEAVDKIARGRVWSGQDALERGLVDKLGGMFDAIDAARSRAKIADSEPLDLAIYGEARGLLTALADSDSFVAKLLGGSPPSTELPEGLLTLAREMGLEQALMLQPNLKAMMPFTLKVE